MKYVVMLNEPHSVRGDRPVPASSHTRTKERKHDILKSGISYRNGSNTIQGKVKLNKAQIGNNKYTIRRPDAALERSLTMDLEKFVLLCLLCVLIPQD